MSKIEEIKKKYSNSPMKHTYILKDMKVLLTHISSQEQKLAEAIECLKFYANGEHIDKESQDYLDFCAPIGSHAKALLEKLKEGK